MVHATEVLDENYARLVLTRIFAKFLIQKFYLVISKDFRINAMCEGCMNRVIVKT